MDHVLWMFKWQARWWTSKAEHSMEGTAGRARVYALRQAALWEHMYNHCAISWSYVDEWIELGQVLPDEEEEEPAGL